MSNFTNYHYKQEIVDIARITKNDEHPIFRQTNERYMFNEWSFRPLLCEIAYVIKIRFINRQFYAGDSRFKTLLCTRKNLCTYINANHYVEYFK